MPIMSLKYPNRAMGAKEIREVLELGMKLPTDPRAFSLQGYKIELITKESAQRWSRARKPHRLLAQCKECRAWIPFGRLAQHEWGKHFKDHPDYIIEVSGDGQGTAFLRTNDGRKFVALAKDNGGVYPAVCTPITSYIAAEVVK